MEIDLQTLDKAYREDFIQKDKFYVLLRKINSK